MGSAMRKADLSDFRMACVHALSEIQSGAKAPAKGESREALVWRLAVPYLADLDPPDSYAGWLGELRMASDFLGCAPGDPAFAVPPG